MSNKKAMGQEKKREAALQQEKSAHKCNGCWCSTWVGYKYTCMMPECIKSKRR